MHTRGEVRSSREWFCIHLELGAVGTYLEGGVGLHLWWLAGVCPYGTAKQSNLPSGGLPRPAGAPTVAPRESVGQVEPVPLPWRSPRMTARLRARPNGLD